MTYVDVRARTYLEFIAPHCVGRVEIITRDIGATIGTELLDEDGRRLVAYRPGTRYASTAKEVAADHIKRTVEAAYAESVRGDTSFADALRVFLQSVVAGDGCASWDPDNYEEEEEW